MITTEVENYPGFPEGVTGPELMELFSEQAERFGTRFRPPTSSSVDFSKRPFTAGIDDERVLRPRRVIIATGARASWLGLPTRERAAEPRRQRVRHLRRLLLPRPGRRVVGGGDTAMEEATVPRRPVQERDAHPPPRRAARLQDHAGARAARTRRSVRLEHARSTEVHDVQGGKVTRRRARRT